jgi:ubiquinone/menaquinone biosynthesis C-methylase UbiE
VNRNSHTEAVRSEFTRTAPVVTQRTKRRFDDMNIVPFSRLRSGGSVLEAGVGTGVFLGLFEDVARLLVGVDVTEAMLVEARRSNPGLVLVGGDGRRLPLRSQTVDLATTAQTLHHVPEPLPFIEELRRVVRAEGFVLVVDQVATERYEETLLMNKLEAIRDPSHAASRSPSTMRSLILSAGLKIVDEKFVEERSTFESWMPPQEFPSDRIAETRSFIDRFGSETGMDFRKEGNELAFTRRRMAILARR